MAFERTSVAGGRPPRAGVAKTTAPPRKNPLASLKMASMLDLKPVLPLELIAQIVDYLEIPDMLRFARVNRRMCDMVYEESRWIARLKRMGVWDDAVSRRQDVQTSIPVTPQRRWSKSTGQGPPVHGHSEPMQESDTGGGFHHTEGRGVSLGLISPLKDDQDGFHSAPLSAPSVPGHDTEDETIFRVLYNVQSIRGKARQEFGKVYCALSPYYNDISRQMQPMNALVFKTFATPEKQAKLLAHLRTFARSDISIGSATRLERLNGAISVFEAAALQELRLAYEKKDIQKSMKRYTSVLNLLDAGQQSIDFFVQNNTLIANKSKYGDTADSLDYSSGRGVISIEKIQVFFNKLAIAYAEEEGIISHGFPNPAIVKPPFVSTIGKQILYPYLTALFDEAGNRGSETYLKTVGSTFAQTRQFFDAISANVEDTHLLSAIKETLITIFEPHLDLYLGAELEFFQQSSKAKVDEWDQALSEQAASTETFLMSNINRQADKKDFLSSFKKVVMMPVNILPSFPTMSSNKPAARALMNGESVEQAIPNELSNSGTNTPRMSLRSTMAVQEAPTTELAAKAAIMSSKLEGIRSLFSIEVALDLVHIAKAGLERAAQFTYLGGEAGESAKTQCSTIFVALLHVLGTRHVKSGFDKAVSHLSDYKPREVKSHKSTGAGVQPLTTFLELVNIADLIQQMLDVFYEQELIGPPVSLDRSDFLSAAVKEKKKFEQMLDERVAAGLGKGIDVLMDEVEYVCATTQLPTDYNIPDTGQISDVGITDTAKEIIQLVSGHTSMLVGSTDKSLLDVFNAEVGLRLFAALCKHLKRQRISTLGSLRLIADMNAYYAYIVTLKNPDLLLYFGALRELGQLYLIDEKDAGDMAGVIAEGDRWRGVFRAEEVLEFAERRADWFIVRPKVEKGLYGQGCVAM
ncbi:putative secretion pathway protein sls2 rcy1 [Phaeomoniella chlamydospora]|uniref:Putative secretion pathway protein sls2 rcy1 n=1 Tax=Phaeomoniella chlamydospora TaxID=158046 RepID=A0A0G2GF70_PHACM|nr:putative secretion pathway protein sls2 rcy1 [Phaeomoniella chlamydospora]